MARKCILTPARKESSHARALDPAPAGLISEKVLPLDMAVDIALAAAQVPPPSIDGTIALGGGFPIRAGDQVVGAIGVSGAPGQDKDEACANAGLAAVAARLK
jgi:hypothetical protein